MKASMADDIGDSAQMPSVQGIVQLKETGRMLQAASMAVQVIYSTHQVALSARQANNMLSSSKTEK